MLAHDIAQLSTDFGAGRVLRRPSVDRPDDDYDTIVAEQGLSFEDFVACNDVRSAQMQDRIKRMA